MKNKVDRVKEKIEWIQNLTVVRMVQGAMRINKDNQLSCLLYTSDAADEL